MSKSLVIAALAFLAAASSFAAPAGSVSSIVESLSCQPLVTMHTNGYTAQTVYYPATSVQYLSCQVTNGAARLVRVIETDPGYGWSPYATNVDAGNAAANICEGIAQTAKNQRLVNHLENTPCRGLPMSAEVVRQRPSFY